MIAAMERSGIIALALALALSAATPGCATTRYHERARLADPAMQLDGDAAVVYVRTKAESAREGSIGGFGHSAAGGCGCE